MFVQIVRFVSLVLGGLAGWTIASAFRIQSLAGVENPIYALIVFIILGAAIGYLSGGFLGQQLQRLISGVEHKLAKWPITDILLAAAGLAGGLALATLLTYPVRYIEIPLLRLSGVIAAYVILGPLGVRLALTRREELARSFSFLGGRRIGRESIKLLDTSVIIDGRITDICAAGFIEGRLTVPRFVLQELHTIADSDDSLKRNRGRRGLDVLNVLQREPQVEVDIYEIDYPELRDVDEKLVKLAGDLGAPILTNDYNLNKVAEIQGVKVLNINELANALKPIVLPGEKMTVNILREGKEAGQGVGYLDDGTMVVVEGGSDHVGEDARVTVTSVLQTPAGRMIFSKFKEAAGD